MTATATAKPTTRDDARWQLRELNKRIGALETELRDLPTSDVDGGELSALRAKRERARLLEDLEAGLIERDDTAKLVAELDADHCNKMTAKHLPAIRKAIGVLDDALAVVEKKNQSVQKAVEQAWSDGARFGADQYGGMPSLLFKPCSGAESRLGYWRKGMRQEKFLK